MAKAELNSALRGLRGRVGEWVFKQYAHGIVVTRVPRMQGIVPSPAQQAHRVRVRDAGKVYREVLDDPVRRKRYTALARKRGIPLPALMLSEYFKTLAVESPRPAKTARANSSPR